MALVSYVQIPEGFDTKYFKGLKIDDKYVFARVTKNTRFLSRKKKLELKNRSVFAVFAEYWKTLDSAEKAAWSAAAAEIGLNNWQLFVHDTAARQKYSYEGLSIPELLHQGYIGHIKIESPDDELKIVQLHPKFYWILRLQAGHKRMWEPVQITEDFSLPLKIQLNYRANLTEVDTEFSEYGNSNFGEANFGGEAGGSPAFAKLYALVWHSYQGVDYETELAIDLDFQTDWKQAEATLSSVLGHVIHYDLFIHVKGLTGDLYFDNIKAEHSAQNWVRDSRCDDISKTLPRIWYLIPQRWAGVVVPSNSFFESTFVDFE